jgi:ElaB/YqjD/DUF883 family membrane-anchored ribosome-binding protein
MAKKTRKKGGMLPLKIDTEKLEEELHEKEKQLSKGVGKLRKNVQRSLEDMDLEELEEEVRKRPMLYLAFAFTAGLALGAIMGRK